MADIVTGTVTGQVDVTSLLMGQSDIRRETAAEISDVRREQAVESAVVSANVKEAGWQSLNKTAEVADRITDQDTAYFIAGQQVNFQNATALAALTASNNANFNQTLAAIQLAATQTSAAATLAGSQSAAASALAAAQTQQMVIQDGAATRALINSQKVDDLRFGQLLAEQGGRFVRGSQEHGHGHGCGERKEGTINYGVPISASYPV